MTDDSIPPLLARRALIGGFAIAAGTAALPESSPARAAGIELPATPEQNLKALVRMAASAKAEDCPFFYNGTIFGIVGEEAPRPLFTFEGLETYWMRAVSADEYEMTGNTCTFLRNIESGAFLIDYANPYTGAINKIEAMVQGGKRGAGYEYSVRGIRPTKFRDKIPEKPLKLWWNVAGDYVWLHNETVYPPGMGQPRKQRQTNFCRREDFANPKIARLQTAFSATVFMPWPKWMEMGERPGHIIWHASGAKLKSLADLPAEFRSRVEKEHPERLTANPDA